VLELYVTVMFFVFLGKRAFDARSVAVLAKSALAFACTYGVHRTLASIGDLRLVVDALVYAAVLLGTRGVRLSDVREVVNMVRNRKQVAQS
jgi:hypothetical protein